QKTKVDLQHVLALVRERGDLQLIPPNSLKLDLKPKPQAPSPKPQVPGRIAKTQRKPSWWTARATAGEVTAGFTKAEILKQAPEDPRAADGVLAKVTGLLEELES
ncbi:MAG: hypothetical protein ACXW2Q_13775, partial [Thermoanaerobaculia bacterium]